MKKSYVIIFFILIALAVVGTVAFKVSSDLSKENKIKSEIREIAKVFTVANIDDDEVNEILERRVIKKGDYAEIESSIKSYYKTLYGDLKNLTFLLDDDNFSNYLSVKNIQDDGPDFLKSRSNLLNSKAQISDYYDKFINSLSNIEYKKTYLKVGVKKYYVDFYLELSDLAISDNLEVLLKQEYDRVLSNIDVYTETFDFLNANKKDWNVSHDSLKFEDTLVLDEYLNLIDKLKKEKNDVISE